MQKRDAVRQGILHPGIEIPEKIHHRQGNRLRPGWHTANAVRGFPVNPFFHERVLRRDQKLRGIRIERAIRGIAEAQIESRKRDAVKSRRVPDFRYGIQRNVKIPVFVIDGFRP